MSIIEAINTPEARAEAQARREALQAEFGPRLAQNPAQANHLYGLAREQSALDQLSALDAQEAAGEVGDIVALDRKRNLYDQLAEGLALQTKFAEAAALTTSPAHKAEYEGKAEAIASIGQPTCECPAEVTEPSPTDAKGTTRQTKRKVEEVYDGERVITLFVCSECKKYSAE